MPLNIRSITSPGLLTALLLVSLAGCQNGLPTPSGVGARAKVEINSPDGELMGIVNLTQGSNGGLLWVNVTGLTTGPHGFHIHETGSCSPDFSAAGNHFTPEGKEHGYLNPNGDHAGDMPNIYASEGGTVWADVFNEDITLDAGPDNSVFDADGSAVIIHEKGDSYGADAGAGGRVACGVIVRK